MNKLKIKIRYKLLLNKTLSQMRINNKNHLSKQKINNSINNNKMNNKKNSKSSKKKQFLKPLHNNPNK